MYIITILGICSFVVKILNCPLFPSMPWCRIHQVVLIDPLPTEEEEYRDIFLVDYVPDVEVNAKVAIDLCMGKCVPGKMRVFMVDSVKKTEVIRLLQDKIINGDFYEIQHNNLREKSKYNLYMNNCWRFSRNVTTHLDQFQTK
jgi:hypothetical protein